MQEVHAQAISRLWLAPWYTNAMSRLTESLAWRALVEHQKQIANTHMRELFARDAERFAKH